MKTIFQTNKMSGRTLDYNPVTQILTIDDGDEVTYYYKVKACPRPHLTSDGGVVFDQSHSAPSPQTVKKVVQRVIVVPAAPAPQVPQVVTRKVTPPRVVYVVQPPPPVPVTATPRVYQAPVMAPSFDQIPSALSGLSGCWILGNHSKPGKQVAHKTSTCQSGTYWISLDDWIARVRKTKGRCTNDTDFCGKCCK